MSLRRGKVWSTFPCNDMGSNKPVTKVIVRSDDPQTQRIIRDDILQAQAVRKPLDEDPSRWEIAFYVPPADPKPSNGDAVEWGSNHADFTPPGGETFRLHKIGNDFDPDAPLH